MFERLGLQTARVPHADRHGCIWLGNGHLVVENGSLRFLTVGTNTLERGAYGIPFQTVSTIFLEPGSMVSHDALRVMARHGTGFIVAGTDGVRCFASMPFGRDESILARNQLAAWSNEAKRLAIARRMYALRLGEVLPSDDIAVLRGMEGARVRTLYKVLAQKFNLQWTKRSYDPESPESDDPINKAINHSSSAVRAAAMIAVAVTSTVPQLGFIHEDSSNSFALDISDLFRESVLLPAAFGAVKEHQLNPNLSLERLSRIRVARILRDKKIIANMIDRIKLLFGDPP